MAGPTVLIVNEEGLLQKACVKHLIENDFEVATSLPGPEARLFANILVSGHGNGRDLHLRTLRAMGVTLTGHFLGATDRIARFAPDLAASVAWGDERYQQVSGLVRAVAERDGLEVPKIEAPAPFDAAAPTELPGSAHARAASDITVVATATASSPSRVW